MGEVGNNQIASSVPKNLPLCKSFVDILWYFVKVCKQAIVGSWWEKASVGSWTNENLHNSYRSKLVLRKIRAKFLFKRYTTKLEKLLEFLTVLADWKFHIYGWMHLVTNRERLIMARVRYFIPLLVIHINLSYQLPILIYHSNFKFVGSLVKEKLVSIGRWLATTNSVN